MDEQTVIPNPFVVIIERLNHIEELLDKIENKPTSESQPPSQNYRLTRREVCARYKISLSSLHSLMKRGDIPFEKIGRKTLFHENDVEDYFVSQKVSIN